jgi:hypothetical protein
MSRRRCARWGTTVPAEIGGRVTVVVIIRNRRHELAHTLGKLAGLPERPAVIVVDNGSADGTPTMVRRAFPEVTLIAARRNLGVVGRNLALRRVTTPTSRSATTTPGGRRGRWRWPRTRWTITHRSRADHGGVGRD